MRRCIRYIRYHIRCHTRHSDKAICYVYLGTLEEALRWATGAEIAVTETLCKAKGDADCQFVVGALNE